MSNIQNCKHYGFFIQGTKKAGREREEIKESRDKKHTLLYFNLLTEVGV